MSFVNIQLQLLHDKKLVGANASIKEEFVPARLYEQKWRQPQKPKIPTCA